MTESPLGHVILSNHMKLTQSSVSTCWQGMWICFVTSEDIMYYSSDTPLILFIGIIVKMQYNILKEL